MVWTDENLIAAFHHEESANAAWRHILDNWRDYYRSPIKKMGGTKEDADDAMMDIVEAFQRRVSAPGFQLKNKLSTYFVRCVINRWMKQAKQNNRIADFFPETNTSDDVQQFAASVEAEILADELRELLDTVMEKALTERCKKIMSLFARDFSMKEIAAEMNYLRADDTPNDDTAKNEKSDCQKKLRQFFLENPSIRTQVTSYWT